MPATSQQPPPASCLGSHLSTCSSPSEVAAGPAASPLLPAVGESSASTLREVFFPPGAAAQDAACADGTSSPASPVAAGGVGDHLSDATPSEAASLLSFKLPAPGEGVRLGRRSTRGSEAAAGAAGGAEGAAGQGQPSGRAAGGWAGLGALKALKGRLAGSRRGSA